MQRIENKRLPKAERREQLLETAHMIVREEGTDALTLGYVAERAGVSKPIAYEHFETRAGLLIALYRQLDDRQFQQLVAALAKPRPRLVDCARVLSRAYMQCYTELGLEWQALAAAMKGDEQMDAACREVIARYVDVYVAALTQYSKLSKRELRVRCVAIIGAGEALAQDMMLRRIDEATAASTLASLIVAWL